MNLRILKKLSKRAAPLLPLLGDKREQFRSERNDNYHGCRILARKHWERYRSQNADTFFEDHIKYPAKDGKGYISMSAPPHPRKGTIMVGSTSGYYEPEWDEECAWVALENLIYLTFIEIDEDLSEAKQTRRFRTPSDILRAAEASIAESRRTGQPIGRGR